MLRNTLFSLLILLMGKCYAQENFFVLIQAEHNQPFYVKTVDKSLSSNAKGRLTLSQLKTGSHHITVGSPQQSFPEQQYTFNIGEKDLEFQLKDLGEKGWGLFNPQTQELVTADKKEVPAARNEGIKKDDAFSRLMAGVVSDTAVMYNTYAMEEVLKDSPVAKAPAEAARVVAATDPPAVKTPAAVTPDTGVAATRGAVHGKQTAVQEGSRGVGANMPMGTVVKLSERKTPKGLRIAFADRPRGRKADTVILIIPLDTVVRADIATAGGPKKGREDLTGGITKTGELKKGGGDSTGGITKTGELKKGGVDSTGASSVAGEPRKAQPDPTRKVQPDSNGALYRTPTELVSGGGEHKDPAAGRRPDSAAPATTETVVRDNPDTIHVYINAGKKAPQEKSDSGVVVQKEADQKVAAHTIPAAGKELYRSKPDSSQKGSGAKLVVMNSDCRNFASDYDVDKLRVKMLEGPKDEDRIQTARKVYKIKCFTTKQIRALSEVFSTDAGKYRFFEASYPFVSDDHFRELADLLADPVYNGKFKAMTGQQ